MQGKIEFDGRGAVLYRVQDDNYYPPTYPTLSDYSRFIRPARNENHTYTRYGTLNRTLDMITEVTRQSVEQVKDLAKLLKTPTHIGSAYHVWHFLKTNVSYRLDDRGTEQVRTPARSWQDRQHGIDCEDFAIFCACLLECMGYPSMFQIVGFGGKEFGHIYCLSNELVLDCVWGQFNEHPQGITKAKQIRWR